MLRSLCQIVWHLAELSSVNDAAAVGLGADALFCHSTSYEAFSTNGSIDAKPLFMCLLLIRILNGLARFVWAKFLAFPGVEATHTSLDPDHLLQVFVANVDHHVFQFLSRLGFTLRL